MKKNKIYYVYILRSSLTNKIFWIGEGRGRRIKQSCLLNKNTKKNNIKKFNFIKQLFKDGGFIIIKKVIENVTERKALLIEEKLIKHFGIENLCNLAYGGIKNLRAQEAKEKSSKSARKSFEGESGIKRRKQLSKIHKDKIVSEETKQKQSKAGIKRWKENPSSVERNLKISKKLTGHIVTEETREKIRQKLLGRISNFKGRHHTEESKEKNRQAHLKKK